MYRLRLSTTRGEPVEAVQSLAPEEELVRMSRAPVGARVEFHTERGEHAMQPVAIDRRREVDHGRVKLALYCRFSGRGRHMRPHLQEVAVPALP